MFYFMIFNNVVCNSSISDWSTMYNTPLILMLIASCSYTSIKRLTMPASSTVMNFALSCM
uniref:Uncharacterized protein n=1 Tax=Staphylococcus phage 184DA TaxID=3110532 RepID=A0AAU6MX26_9CAUD